MGPFNIFGSCYRSGISDKMQTVSSDYLEVIDKQFRRRVTMNSILSLANPADVERTSFESGSPESVISNHNQLYDQITKMSYGWNTLEPDRVNSSGDFVIFDLDTVGQYGFWTDEMCDEFGIFATPQTIKLTYSEILSFNNLMVFFDNYASEYASDFEITFYDNQGVSVYNKRIPDNDSVNFSLDNRVNFVSAIELKIYKWSKPFRRAKVLEILNGSIIEFTDNEIVGYNSIDNFSILEEVFIVSQQSLDIENLHSRFNPLHTEGIFNQLQNKQIFQTEFNINGVTLSAGIGYLWNYENYGNITSFKMRSVYEFINGLYIAESYEEITAMDLFIKLFSLANITEYSISPELADIVLNQYVPEMNLSDAFQFAANAASAYIFIQKSGIITIELIRNIFTNSVAVIDFNFIYPNGKSYYPQINQKDLIDGVTANIYKYNVDSEAVTEPLVTDLEISFPDDGFIYIEYGAIADSVTATASSGSFSDVVYFADKLKLSGSGDIVISIEGRKITQNVIKKTVTKDNISSIKIENIAVVDNPFINTISRAVIMSNLKLQLNDYYTQIVFNDRGRPDLELTDFITVETEYGFINGLITEQRFNWNKFLTGYVAVDCKKN